MTVRVAAVQNDPRGLPAEDFRLITAHFLPSATSGLHSFAGVLPAPAGYLGEVTLLGPEVIQVNPGRWVVPGTQSAVQGDYIVINDASVERAIGPRDASLSRIDRLVVQVGDTGYAPNDGTDGPDVRVIPGTPVGSGPVAPALPPNAVHLGYINVPTTGGTVTFTPSVLAQQVPVGGVQPVRMNDAAYYQPGSYDGQLRDHPAWGLQRWSAATGVWDDTIIDRLRFNNVQDLTLTSTGHPFQIGPDNAENLALDTQQVQVRTGTGSPSYLGINIEAGPDGEYGTVGIGLARMAGGTPAAAGSQYHSWVTPRLRVAEAGDAQARADDGTGTPSVYHPFQIGPDGGQHVLIDTNEGMARSALTGVTTANPAGTGGGQVVPFAWHGLTVDGAVSDSQPINRGQLNGYSGLANQSAWQNLTVPSGWALFSGGPGARWIYMNGSIYFSIGLSNTAAWTAGTVLFTWSSTWRPRYAQYFTAMSGGIPWAEVGINPTNGQMYVNRAGTAGTGFVVSGSFIPNVVF